MVKSYPADPLVALVGILASSIIFWNCTTFTCTVLFLFRFLLSRQTRDFVFRGCSAICSSIGSPSCLSNSCGYLQSSSTRLNTIARSLAETSFQYTPRFSFPCLSSSVLPHQIPSVYLLLFSLYSKCFLPMTTMYS